MNTKTLTQRVFHGGFDILSGPPSTRMTATALLVILFCATFARGQAQIAAPPNLVVTVEPSDGGNVVFLPVAAGTAKGQPQALLALQLTLKNQGAAPLRLNKVKVSFTGPPFAAATLYNTDFTVDGGKTKTLSFSEDQNIKLSFPAP